MRRRVTTGLILATLSGCTAPESVTAAEAIEAIRELNRSSLGERATTHVIDISTDVTIGDRSDAAAERLADLWDSQAECTTVTVAENLVTVDYGTLDDACVFQGQTYAGINTVGVLSTDDGALEVGHTYAGFTNGDVRVDGDAQVTWSGDTQTRRVVAVHTWTDLDTGAAVEVDGDHEWGLLSGDSWLDGYTLDGTRDWTSEAGDWRLDMSDVEVRLDDPCPQAGTFRMTLPSGGELELTYTRVDDSTIEARIAGTRRERVFHIDALGIPAEVEE
jgi:hypothetical protein